MPRHGVIQKVSQQLFAITPPNTFRLSKFFFTITLSNKFTIKQISKCIYCKVRRLQVFLIDRLIDKPVTPIKRIKTHVLATFYEKYVYTGRANKK